MYKNYNNLVTFDHLCLFENTLNLAISSFFIAYIKEVKNSIPEEKKNGGVKIRCGGSVKNPKRINGGGGRLFGG